MLSPWMVAKILSLLFSIKNKSLSVPKYIRLNNRYLQLTDMHFSVHFHSKFDKYKKTVHLQTDRWTVLIPFRSYLESVYS